MYQDLRSNKLHVLGQRSPAFGIEHAHLHLPKARIDLEGIVLLLHFSPKNFEVLTRAFIRHHVMHQQLHHRSIQHLFAQRGIP